MSRFADHDRRITVASGIYEIKNLTNGKRYVGSTANLKRRWRDHKSTLGRGVHTNGRLQNSWNKYGEGAFEFSVIEYWEPEFLISFEQWWTNMLRPEYNLAKVAGSNLGYKHTDEAKANMSAVKTGHKATDETRAKLSASKTGNTNVRGHKLSAEHKAKLSAALIGNTRSLGYRHTDETRAKMSGARKGRPWTPAAYKSRGLTPPVLSWRI